MAIVLACFAAPLRDAPRRHQALLHDHRALSALRAGDEEATETEWLAALALWPEDTRAYSALGDFYRLHGQPEVAGLAYRRLLEIAPHYPHVYCRLALAARDWGSPLEEEKDAREELRLQPDCIQALDLLSLQERHKGNSLDARHLAEKAYRLAPTDEQAVATYAQSFLPGEPEKAIPVLEKARHALPNTWDVAFDLGYAYARVGTDPATLQKAQTELERAIRIRPQSSGAYVELCRLLVQENRAKDAIPYGTRAVQLDPYNPQSYYYLGQSLDRAGENAAAQKIVTRFETLQAAQDAKGVLERRHAVAPGDPKNARQLAAAEVKLGLIHEAVETLEGAIALHPHDRQLAADLKRLIQQGAMP